MTTTVCFQGKDGKNSSKVLAPPGGKSNISLFGSPDEPARAPAQPPKQQPPASQSQAPFATQAKAQDYGPAKSYKRVSNFNPVTGEPYATSPAAPAQSSPQPQPQAKAQPQAAVSSPAQPQQQQQQPSPQQGEARTSVKIYNPPGGRSSITF